MARKHTKCTNCNDLLWFGDNDAPPQRVQCVCNDTALTESGPEGAWTELTQAEIDSLTS